MKVALASGEGHTELENLLRMLEIPQERNRVLHSLGYSANRDVLSRVLTFSLDPRLRDQESVMVIESVCQNRIGVRLAWDFFKVGHHHIFVPWNFSFLLSRSTSRSSFLGMAMGSSLCPSWSNVSLKTFPQRRSWQRWQMSLEVLFHAFTLKPTYLQSFHLSFYPLRYPSSSVTTLKLVARERSARRKKISASTCTGKTAIWTVWLGSWKLRKTRRLVNLRSYYQLL